MNNPITPGTRLGRYEIKSQLGAGGMGEVYLAYDTELDRHVAIKVLAPHLAEHSRALQRFIQEAKAASALNHPNILTVYEIAQIENTAFFVSEFVEGITLRQRIKTGKLKLGEVLDIAIQVCSALVAAHQAGIVHRDIKPENIVLRKDGYVKVLDFGLAKLLERSTTSVDREAPTKQLINTDPGAILGTVNYMSPEQAAGKDLDGRSDIWSLGVVLFEMLTGSLPFSGQSASHTIVSILDDDPPALDNYLSDVPEALQEIVTDALTKDVDARFQTAKQMLARLQRLKQRVDHSHHIEHSVATGPTASLGSGEAQARDWGQSVQATNAVSQRSTAGSATHTLDDISTSEFLGHQIRTHKKSFSLLATFVVVLIAVASVAIYKSSNRGHMNAVQAFSAMKIEKLTDTGKTGNVAISPDGKMIVHVLDDAGQQSLWATHIATNSNVQIQPPGDTKYGPITFSPDGNYIYFLRFLEEDFTASVYSVPVFGGEPRKIIDDVWSAITFSADGKRFAFVRSHSIKNEDYLMIADADGSNLQRLATFKDGERIEGNQPAWSPDGHVIAIGIVRTGKENYDQLSAVNVSDGSAQPIGSQHWDFIGRLGWLSDGSGVVANCYEKGARVAQHFLISYPGGTTQRITNDLNHYDDLTLTGDTRTIATVQEDRALNIWIAPDGNAASLRALTSGSFKYEGQLGVSWAGEKKIVYAAFANGSGDIWTINVDGSGVKRITNEQESHSSNYPAIAPDGRTIFFISDRDGKSHLWRMDIDGTNAKQMTFGETEERTPSVTPDGRSVLYSSHDGENLFLFKIPVEGGQPSKLTEGFLADGPVMSPDGKWIGAFYRESGGAPLKFAIIASDAGKPSKLLAPPPSMGNFFLWLPDNRSLAFISTQKGVSNVWTLPIDGGKPKQITDFTTGLISGFALSGGKPTLFSRGETKRDVVLITGFR